jgi:hypothetical protein
MLLRFCRVLSLRCKTLTCANQSTPPNQNSPSGTLGELSRDDAALHAHMDRARYQEGSSHNVHSASQADLRVQAHYGRRRGQAPPGLRLRRHQRVRPVPVVRRLPQRSSWRLPRRVPLAPHRGIETITYVLAGAVDHGDSLGNKGKLGAGDVQWMTAGSGILHQEMPQGDPHGRMHGFQLWANLPSSLKMTAPRYQDVRSSDIPEVVDDDGTRVRVVCGDFWGQRGPVDGIAADPRYLDVCVPAGRRKTLPVETYRHGSPTSSRDRERFAMRQSRLAS